MTRSKRAKIILDELNRLYPNPQVTLTHWNTFTFLIAVILSAQTTDEKVNKILPALFAKGKDAKTLAQMSEKKIQEIIRPLGLSQSKSKNIKETAKIIAEKYDGTVPHTFKELEALPGVGHKTASVIMSQAFDLPAFPIDTHIHRLLTKWGISKGNSVKQTEEDAKAIFPENTWHDLHLQLIYYGRERSPARGKGKKEDIISKKLGIEN